MNREFVELGQESSFATAIVGTFFASTQSFQLSVAGHPRPMLYRRTTGRWELFEIDRDVAVSTGLLNTPMGISKSVAYGHTHLNLSNSDMILAYTDGLTETRVTDGKHLQTKGLLPLVQTLDGTRAD